MVTADPAGLDPAAIAAALPSARTRFVTALGQVRDWVAEHAATGGYVSWSGGRDSTCVAALASAARPGIPLVWFDSGLEFPDTAPYLHRLAEQRGWNLQVIPAEPDALTVMAASGAWDHDAEVNWNIPDLHTVLVTEPARKARERFGRAELWGLRAAESAERRALLTPGAGRYTRADGTATFSPVWAWREVDVTGYLAAEGIPEHPAYRLLRAAGATGKDLRVGLAVDGNNLQHGRIRWLRRIYPAFYTAVEARLPRLREWS